MVGQVLSDWSVVYVDGAGLVRNDSAERGALVPYAAAGGARAPRGRSGGAHGRSGAAERLADAHGMLGRRYRSATSASRRRVVRNHARAKSLAKLFGDIRRRGYGAPTGVHEHPIALQRHAEAQRERKAKSRSSDDERALYVDDHTRKREMDLEALRDALEQTKGSHRGHAHRSSGRGNNELKSGGSKRGGGRAVRRRGRLNQPRPGF